MPPSPVITHQLRCTPGATPGPAWRRRTSAGTAPGLPRRTPPPCNPPPRTARQGPRRRTALAPPCRELLAATRMGAGCTTAPLRRPAVCRYWLVSAGAAGRPETPRRLRKRDHFREQLLGAESRDLQPGQPAVPLLKEAGAMRDCSLENGNAHPAPPCSALPEPALRRHVVLAPCIQMASLANALCSVLGRRRHRNVLPFVFSRYRFWLGEMFRPWNML